MQPDIAKARRLVAAASDRPALTEGDAKEVLECFGLRVPHRAVIPFGERPGDRLDALVPPFAVKVISASILHKTDVGGVKLGVKNPAEVGAAIAAMADRLSGHAIEGWLVEEMIAPGPEIVIGGAVDERFGPNVMVGLGGVLVELFEDVAFGICPIDAKDARDMLESLRGVRLLRGWRGAPIADEAAVVDALLRIGGEDGLMMTLADQVKELDINPLIVGKTGAVAADARLVLRSCNG